MAYDNPLRTYPMFVGVPVNAAFTRNIRGPKGKRGLVRRLFGSATTSVSFTTTGPQLSVTTTAAPVPNRKGGTVYAASTPIFLAVLPALVAPIGFDLESQVSVPGGPGQRLVDENGLAFMSAADTDLVIALAPAVGTPAGVIDFTFEIHWI